jgi:tetratricopeptide (TPR) repeat protein
MAEPTEKADVLMGQGRALLAIGDPDEAIKVLGTALDFATSAEGRAELLRWRSRAYLAAESYQEALANLVAAEELAPSPLYLYRRGAIYQASGDAERAVVDLEAFLQDVDPGQVDPETIADAENRLLSLTETP